MLKVVTWNVNSVSARLERVLDFIKRETPDVLCLQELKCLEEKYPSEVFKALGYESVVLGQRTYNGVAILSRLPIENPRRGFADPKWDEAARLVRANIRGVEILCAYFPNGQAVGSDKYAYKLQWMTELRKLLDEQHSKNSATCLLGDFNVAPLDIDVHSPEKWRGQVLCSEPEREKYRLIESFGFQDVFRKHHPEGKHYSWWDYRQLAFPKNDGLRIDLILSTPPLWEKCVSAKIHRDERKGAKPSDHAPVEACFEI